MRYLQCVENNGFKGVDTQTKKKTVRRLITGVAMKYWSQLFSILYLVFVSQLLSILYFVSVSQTVIINFVLRFCITIIINFVLCFCVILCHSPLFCTLFMRYFMPYAILWLLGCWNQKPAEMTYVMIYAN